MDELPNAHDHIQAYRATVLRRLEYQLIRFRAKASVEDIQRFIYERDEERPASEYIGQLMDVFNASDAELDDAISVVQDAWNYLPHRALGGRCPAEVMLGLMEKEHRRPGARRPKRRPAKGAAN
jgi:hypothetical protein